MTTIKEIETALKEIEKSKKKIAAMEDNEPKIAEYLDEKGRLTTIESLLTDLINEAGTNATDWEPDEFSKGKKDISWLPGRRIGILRSTTTRRKIIPSEFVARYPLHANVMIQKEEITIPIGKLEPEIGKEAVTEISTITTTHSYNIKVRSTPKPVTKKKERAKTKKKEKVIA